MKKFAILLAPALIALSTLPCLAADSPFAGKWKLDPAKSTFTGSTFTYSMTSDGLLRFSDGAFQADYDPSGKPHTAFSNVVATWTKVDDHTFDSEGKIGDMTIAKFHLVLSPDGKTLTVDETDYRADGGQDHTTTVNKRVSGGSGLVGEWKNVKTQPPPANVTISASNGKIDLEVPEYKVVVAGPTDGSYFPMKGPTMPDGFSTSFKPDGANKFMYSNKANDKVVLKGVMTVEGNTLTDTSWVPGKENEKTIAVYHRE